MSTGTTVTPPASGDTARGMAFAVAAYGLWGFLPLYLKLLDHVDPVEVVAHRILWSVPVAGLVLVALGRTADLRAALRDPRALALAAVTAALVTLNWSIYVVAIATERTIDAALGYYINPLFSMFLGWLLLGERLSRLQTVAVALAALAVAVLTLEAGGIPIIALGLTVTWGFYAYAKRSLPIGPNQGFLLEVLILSPVALGYVAWVQATGTGQFLSGGAGQVALFVGLGAVTAIPLMLYANGAKGLTLSTIAILQFIAPTMIFLVAVFVFGEEIGRARAIAFPLIWAALGLYVWAMWRKRA